ncbi:iron-siderophore ABC transporter substrate-binding protein [Naasia lichenicola]|uniref:Iron-siderophore ABC transporter substrate-binding protein n=1 Tax=Naasia lichenicola TaxID=2565933 RepID=A0A4S4FJD4_9MICO|nr:iron-siderophore ABC transporter substrate-binding protein [Naasia lichenicola]THG29246.1 iron-siderophore ABC transporter substrate-binding protein [Naasia lichenicola]
MKIRSFRHAAPALAALAAATVLLAGCSTGDAPAGDAASGSAASTGAFPATVTTKFGDVTVDEEPQRIVALGWGDAETALALGFQPVGASDWLGFGGDGVGPWAEDLYDESPEIIGTLEPSYEAIAALEPDLILDVKGSGDQERYDRLSSIATTIGVPEGGDSYLTDWQDQITMISTALGVPDEGEQVIADVAQATADAAAAHPEWAGLTASAATKTSEGWGAYVEGGERVQLLEDLGFVQNPDIAALPANAGGFSVDISTEQLDVLDADVIVAFPIFIETTEITDDPLWQQIPAVAAGHSVVIDGDISAAYSLGTSLARVYAVEQLVPLLEAATAS